jgi:LPXTG-motif cell wall-anchored protein
VPSACRRIAALLVVACLGVAGPVTVVHAQTSTTAQGGEDLQPLTPTPQGEDGGSPGPGTSTTPSAGGSAAKPPPTTLPDTGVDARLLLLAGATLLVSGLGLRLRFAPERF